MRPPRPFPEYEVEARGYPIYQVGASDRVIVFDWYSYYGAPRWDVLSAWSRS